MGGGRVTSPSFVWEVAVKPTLLRFGESQSPVVVIDDLSRAVDDIAALADQLAPFPLIEGNYYPGVRRVIARTDVDADAYVERTCRDAAQFLGGAFGVEGF